MNKRVEMELLIEGNRKRLFEKFTNQNHPDITISQDQEAFTYNVEEVNHLGNEVVFNVTLCSTSFKYYAFKLKGYLCFPAFLAGCFEINEPVCLVVGDDFKYYYVFQRKSEELSLRSIFSNAEKLRGDYVFNPSTVGTNLFTLDSENQKMRCFALFKKAKLLGKVLNEFSKFPTDLQIQIIDSKTMPNYSFVPLEAIDEFKSLYESLFNEEFIHGFFSLVHKKSESYGELIKFMKAYAGPNETSESWVDFNFPIGAYKKRFDETKYRRKEKIFPYIKRHILSIDKSIVKENPFQNFFSATLVVLQSSGYGKSKTFLELGSEIPVFYSSLQPSELGYPGKSFYLSTFIDRLDALFVSPKCHSNTACAVVYAFILRIIYLISRFKEKISFSKAIDIDIAIDSILVGDCDSNFEVLYRGLEDICKDPKFEVKIGDKSPGPISLPKS